MRKVCMLLILISSFSGAYGQFNEELEGEEDFWDKVYFGGNFGFQLGNVTFVEVSPLVGYRITDDFSAGVGVTYQYFRAKTDAYKFETNIYGGKLFARHMITQQLFAYTEYESLSLQFIDRTFEIQREWVPGFFVGGGIFLPLGGQAGFSIMALYNLMHDELRSPYNEPWVIRVGITAGF